MINSNIEGSEMCMMLMISFFIVPMIFFFIGFLFKKFRPYYRPIEFVLVILILSMITVLATYGSQLFVSMLLFIQIMLMYTIIFFVFAFMGLLTDISYNWFKNKFDMLNGFVHVLVLLAMLSTFMMASFSVQFMFIVLLGE